MNRGIVGNLVGFKSVMLFVLAFAVLFCPGGARAQDTLTFKDVYVDFHGATASGIAAASGILAASDIDKDIWKLDGDGNDDYAKGLDGMVNTAEISNATQLGHALKDYMARPIVANFESAGSTSSAGDELVIMAVIQGVTSSWITSMKDGSVVSDGKTGAQLLSDMLTADFDHRLFAGNTSSSLYSGISPSSVTSINTARVKNAINGGIDSSTSALVIWDLKKINGLIVGATNAIYSRLSLSATMYINGGDTPKHVGPTNLVGLETGSSHARFLASPAAFNDSEEYIIKFVELTNQGKGQIFADSDKVGYTDAAFIEAVTDYSSHKYYTGTENPIRLENTTSFLDANKKVPFQFRRDDYLTIRLDMRINETLDGEPDEYFGPYSDTLEFSGQNATATDGGRLRGAKFTVTAQLLNGNQVLSSAVDVITPSTAGDQIVSVSASISDALVTSSSFQKLTLVATYTDEIGAATSVSLTHAVDTAAPFVTSVELKSSGTDSTGGDIGAGDLGIPSGNQARLTLQVDGNGEQNNKASQWLNVSVAPSAMNNDGVKDKNLGTAGAWTMDGTPNLVYHLGKLDYPASEYIQAVSEGGALIKAIPADLNGDGTVNDADLVGGASVTISVTTTVNNVSIRHAGLIVCVSDDARNPALVYPAQSRNEDQTLNGASSLTQDSATAFINTLYDYFSVSNFSPFVIANDITSSTVEIDNIGPLILNATLSIVGLPAGYWESGDPGYGISSPTETVFSSIKMTREIVTSEVNKDILTKLGHNGATDSSTISSATQVLDVTRGTAADSNQAGSPLKLVVTFKPKNTGDTYQAEDTDEFKVPAVIKNGVELFNSRFNFEFYSKDLGYATKGIGVNSASAFSENKPMKDWAARWNLADATIMGTAGNEVAYATFYDLVGIPQANFHPLLKANQSGYDETITVWVSDKANNYSAPKASNQIVVDVSKPVASLTGKVGDSGSNLKFNISQISDGREGATSAATVILVTNTDGKTYDELVASTGVNLNQLMSSKALAAGDVTNNAAFLNARDVVGATAVEVHAGYTIIISATFQEPAATTSNEMSSEHVFISSSDNVYFPYGIDWTGATTYMDTAQTTFGKFFKTISADFSDFSTGDAASMVLPDVLSIRTFASGSEVADTAGSGKAAKRDIICATWFYYINGDTINYEFARSDVRSVTLQARDLSGNVSSVNVLVATADFNIPELTILDYQLTIPKRGIKSTIIERDENYGTIPADKAAAVLSQATVNLEDASAYVYVKVGTGTTKGGPFTDLNYLQCDFRPLGGNLVNPNLITYPGGAPVTSPGSVGVNEIIYATFWTSKFETVNDSGAKADRKIVVYATASSFGVGTKQAANGVQVDHTVPSPTVGSILEIDQTGTRTNNSFDGYDDGQVRPGQTVSLNAQFTMDNADKANQIPIITELNASEFGTSTIPFVNRTLAANNTVYSITWTFGISSTVTTGAKKAIVSITDAAGNDAQKNSPTINVLGSRPTILSTIVSASNFINYVTQAHGLRLAYHNVGRKSLSAETIWEPSAVVRAGDMLTVTAVVNINDNAYTGLQSLTSDFSDFGAGSAIEPTQQHISGTIITATWENVIVTSSAPSKHAGVVRINAVNPAGVSAAAGPMLSSISVAVDNTAPVVSYELKYYKEKDGELELQTNLTEINPSKSTYYASVVASVTYTDGKTLKDIWKFGTGSSMLAAMITDASLHVAGIPKGGSYYPWFNLTNSRFINDNLGLTAPDFWALSQSSSVWHDSQSSTDGPVISGPTATLANIANIKNSTNNVLNVWYGIDQHGKVSRTMKLSANPVDNHKVKDYAFVMSASDAVGNVGAVTMQPVIEVDVTPPSFTQVYNTSDKLNNSVVTNISKLDVKYADGNKYTPAIYAGEVIKRPTRVTKGTVIVVEFEVSDNPDKSDEFEIGIDGDEFDAENFTFVNVNSNTALSPLPSGIADYPLGDPEHKGYSITPGLLSAEVMHVTMEFTVGKDAGNDFSVVTTNESTAVAPANYIAGGALNSVLIFDATDSMENHSGNTNSSFLEVDTKGPQPLTSTILGGSGDSRVAADAPGSSIFALSTRDKVQAISTVPNRISSATAINALQGSWIVWAATIVVDGTEPENLSEFSLNWSTFEEDGSTRFETGNEYILSGTKPYLNSATRSILFVTAARKLADSADSHDAKRMVVTMVDRFGNKTEHKTGLLAIGSSGPNATELVMTIDGKPQTVYNNVELGIGKAIDASESSMEIYPGASLIVEATVNTIGGEAPDNILLDLSDLYPSGMKSVVNKIIPSVTMENREGSIYVRWDKIAYDFWKVPSARAGVWSGSKWLLDEDMVNTMRGTTRKYNGLGPLINDVTVTASSIDFDALNVATNAMGLVKDATITGDADLRETVNNLIGLPGIMVQPGAAADTIALVTIYVDDTDSLFNPEHFLSTAFALDSKPPRASITFSVTRALKAKKVVQEGYRKGFPVAPSLDTQGSEEFFYNRVRVKDNIAVIVDITNALINGKGNDKARALPGYFPAKLDPSPFLSMDKASMINNVTIDLTQFNSAAGNENIYPTDGEFTVAERYVSGINVITATFYVEVAGDKGTTAKLSNTPVDVTPTMVDDSGNRPYDNVYDLSIKRYMTDLAIDNTPPSISGSLKVGIVSGTATIGEHILGPGSVVEGGASIAAGSTLSVTVTVTDTLDHPLDIVNNTNYGTFDLSAENLKIDKSKISMLTNLMSLTGDSVSVPFIVTLPNADEGQSTLSFQFIVHATDTLGNYDYKASGDKFKFDSNPNIDYRDALGNLLATPVQVNLNAAGYAPGVTPVSSKIVADVLDVGGLAKITWVTDTISTGIVYTVQDADGNDVPGLTLDLTGGPQSSSLSIDISVPIGSSAIYPVYATATAMDVMGNTNEKQTQMVQWNINQPPVITNEISYSVTSGGDVTNATVGETLGLGFNTALADIREVTITEGDVLAVTVSASDINVPADAVIYTVTGSALSGAVVVNEATYTDNGDGTVLLSLNTGYKVVTGTDEATQIDFEVMAGDAKNTAPDVVLVVVNVEAKSAVPTLEVVKVTAGSTELSTTLSDLSIAEGQKLTIVLEGKDAGDEMLDLTVETLPAEGVDYLFEDVAVPGIVSGTFTFTPDANAASVGNHVSPIDPFLAKFIVKNSTETTTLNRIIGIDNANQAPVISATASVTKNGVLVSGPTQLGDEGTINANAGDVVKLTFISQDPDATALSVPADPIVTKGEGFVGVFDHTNVTTNLVQDDYTLTIPSVVTPSDATVTIVYKVSEATANPLTKTATYTIVVVPREIGPADLQDVVAGQGFGGNTNVRLKSVDNFSITGSAASAGAFLLRQGGGSDRAVYVSTGDVDGDGNQDFVSSMGPITASATFANTVIAKTSERPPMVIGNAFQAFQKGESDHNYNYGDIRTAVGNFIGSTTADQIAVAQGFGGNNVIRIYQYTGRPRPDGFAAIAQFNGLAAGWANNASGGLTIAAGDLDGDDKDELIVGQTPSNTSRTQFRVLDIAADGSIENIATGVAFPGRRRQQGGGGIEIAVVNLDGQGLPEIVFAQMGNTGDYETDADRNTYSKNVFTVQKPILSEGVIQPFTSDNVIMSTGGTNRFIGTFWTEAINPSGALSVAGIEANGLADGSELIVGTGAVYSIAVDGDKTIVQAVKPAPLAKYTFVKVDYDGSVISGTSGITNLGQERVGFGAFASVATSPFDPTSGAVFVGSLDAQAEPIR